MSNCKVCCGTGEQTVTVIVMFPKSVAETKPAVHTQACIHCQPEEKFLPEFSAESSGKKVFGRYDDD